MKRFFYLSLYGIITGLALPGLKAWGQTPAPTAIVPLASVPAAVSPVPTALVLSTPVPAVPVLKQYTIEQDDTLWDLADSFYGKPWLWPLFLKFNSIPNPDLIHPGQTILFPSEEVLVGIADKSPQQVTQERETLQSQTTPVVVTSPPTPQAPPSSPVTAATPVPTVKTTPSPSPTVIKTPTFKVTGSKTINLSYSEAQGNTTTGITNTGYNRNETLTLHMEGQLNDEVKISGNFAQSDLALQDEYDLTLSTKHWDLYFGDFSASLPGSQFLSSGLSTTGLKLTGHYDNWDVTALYATPQGRPVYDKFFGNNTQGPYLIPTVPLVPGSEVVTLNGQKLARGTDYSLDYTLGQLTFISRVIQLTDVVEVTAESSSSVFNTQIFGYHADVALIGKVDSLPSSSSASPPSLVNRNFAGVPLTVPGQPVSAMASTSLTAAPVGGGLSTQALPPQGATVSPSEVQWVIGQGYLGQIEQPDANVTTATGQVAADTHILELDSTLNLGPRLKLSGEIDGSIQESLDPALAPSLEGAAYYLDGETFQGPFHLVGKISGTSPNFTSIGNLLTSGDTLNWMAQADYKAGANFYAQVDRTYQRNSSLGYEDETTTDHGEARDKPGGWPEFDYVYYNSQETQANPLSPMTQGDLRNTASLIWTLPASLSLKTSALQESQTGTNLGENNSYGGSAEVSSVKWKNFNFDLSGEWKLTDIVEAGTNTSVPQTAPGNNIPSQTYNFTMEGKPLDHLTLTGKGSYSNAPPGPPQAQVSATYQTDPLKWLNSNGSYSLQFQQTQALGATVPEDLHTGSGSLEMTPLTWLKLTTQPSFQLDILVPDGVTVSENLHQYYKAALTPGFGTFSADYTLDQYWTWDSSTAGFPLNFYQQTETTNLTGQKPLGQVNAQVSYKRVNEEQQNLSGGATIATQTLTQTENDAVAWTAGPIFTFTLSHTYNQLNQVSPGQGNIANPLLPYGPDTFNTTFSTNSLNAFTTAHTFSLKVNEQLSKELSIYEQGGFTETVDHLEGGTVFTYSPAAGFTWRPGNFLSWTASYQYNGSSGEVDTTIQTAQTTLSANLNSNTTLAVNWSYSRADNPFVLSQQGNASYTMNF